MREESISIPLTGEITKDQYQINCKNCGNIEVIDYEPSEAKPWICICKLKDQPGQFYICSNHGTRWWGQSSDCLKCLEEKANGEANKIRSIHIDYGLTGAAKNLKKTNIIERDGRRVEKQLELEQKTIEANQKYKKAQIESIFALVELPKLLKKIDSKLDKLLHQTGGEFIVNE